MSYLIGYLLAAHAFMFLLAWRSRDPAVRAALFVTLLWPVTLSVVTLQLCLEVVGWCFDFSETPEHLSTFGFRRPNDGWPGFAVRGFGVEFMLWKARK